MYNLLFDENISYRIVKKLEKEFPNAKHTGKLGLGIEDVDIWEYARQEKYTIVTFDKDFHDLTLSKGIPPKIIWLRMGNIKTDDLAQVFKDKEDKIKTFLEDTKHSCLELF